jgi:hypothetical protein
MKEMTDIFLEEVVSHTSSTSSYLPTTSENERRGRLHEEKTTLNRMGRIYNRVLNFSIITRYMIYVAPFALLLAIPIVLSQTGTITGSVSGTNQKKFWIWIEIVWLSFWVMKIVAYYLPNVFEFLIGVVNPGVKKYALLLRAVEKPLSFFFWMLVNQATFPAVSTHYYDQTLLNLP